MAKRNAVPPRGWGFQAPRSRLVTNPSASWRTSADLLGKPGEQRRLDERGRQSPYPPSEETCLVVFLDIVEKPGHPHVAAALLPLADPALDLDGTLGRGPGEVEAPQARAEAVLALEGGAAEHAPRQEKAFLGLGRGLGDLSHA